MSPPISQELLDASRTNHRTEGEIWVRAMFISLAFLTVGALTLIGCQKLDDYFDPPVSVQQLATALELNPQAGFHRCLEVAIHEDRTLTQKGLSTCQGAYPERDEVSALGHKQLALIHKEPGNSP